MTHLLQFITFDPIIFFAAADVSCLFLLFYLIEQALK